MIKDFSNVILLGLIGTYMSIIISLLFIYLDKITFLEKQNQIIMDITKNPVIWEFYNKTINHLKKAIDYDDDLYKELIYDLKERGSNIVTIDWNEFKPIDYVLDKLEPFL